MMLPFELPPAEQERLHALAQPHHLEPGAVIFYEGDPPTHLYLLTQGRVAFSQGQQDALPGDLLDPLAALGGLPQGMKATAAESCELLRWELDALWDSPLFEKVVRRFLAQGWRADQVRRAELDVPIHYSTPNAQITPGPFRFEDVQMIFAFCEAPAVPAVLPPGLQILQRPLRAGVPVLVALADFPLAYPEASPDQLFAYRETTVFLPVRYRSALGFYVPFILPSAWEPILIGREVYGFPKQLGNTVFAGQSATATGGGATLHLVWQGAQGVAETRLVRALLDWLGLAGRLSAAAFQAGEVLRRLARLPAYRRVDVYNYKCVLAADATPQHPIYALQQLTRATFGVVQWQYITQLKQPYLAQLSGIFADLTLHEAFRATLDMRLSTGRVIKDYLHDE